MEVAQIARGIVVALRAKYGDCEWMPSGELIEAISLAHDLGHPPFGHAGEVAMNLCFRNAGGFEGNGQTLRILSKIEKTVEGYGLNPTRRTLLGVLKYPVSYSSENNLKSSKYNSDFILDKSNKPPKCYLDSEQDVVDFIFEPFSDTEREYFIKNKSKSIDTSIMELADDIAYQIYDFDDALALDLIDNPDSLWKEITYLVPELKYKKIKRNCKESERKSALAELIHQIIIGIEVQDKNIECVDPVLLKNAKIKENHMECLNKLKKCIMEEVIKTPQVRTLESRGARMIVEIEEALRNDDGLFPIQIQEYLRETRESDKDNIRRDYIAGMTDTFAARFYERLFSPRRGSIFEIL